MSLTVNPVIPMGWWVAVVVVAFILGISWGAYALSKKKLNLSWFISVAVLVALLGAMLNPGIVTSEEIKTDADKSDQSDSVESTYDLYLVVDTTSSIAAEDWNAGEPRLVGVKSDIEDIVAQFPNSRYTLITFDSVATMRVPITNDSSALLSTVTALQQEVTGNSKGSSVGAAAGLLSETLEKNANPDRQSIVFFFSDGEQTSDEDIESYTASTPFISSGLVLGYGTEQGGRMKQRIGYAAPSDNYIKDAEGNEGISIIDQTNLNNIADELGVKYVHRIYGEALDVSPDSDNSAIDSIDTKRFGVFGLYWIFAIIAFLLMTFALVKTTREIRKYSVRGARRGLDR